jgi:hypothetical protein
MNHKLDARYGGPGADPLFAFKSAIREADLGPPPILYPIASCAVSTSRETGGAPVTVGMCCTWTVSRRVVSGLGRQVRHAPGAPERPTASLKPSERNTNDA